MSTASAAAANIRSTSWIAERSPIPLVALLVFLALPALSSDPSYQNTLTLALVWGFWALSLNIVWGYGGQFSLAQGALGGLAAYSSVLFVQRLSWPEWAAIIVATAMTVVASVVVALVCLQLEGFRFAIMTLSFALAAVGLAAGLDITGRNTGLIVDSRWPVIDIGPLHWDLNSRLGGFTVLMMLVFLLFVFLLRLILGTREGRGMIAIREDAALARSLGISPGRYRTLAFALSALVCAVAGIFQARYYLYIYPSLFSFDMVVTVIVVLTLGGRGRLFGPLIGGLIYATLTNLLHIGGEFQASVFGAAVILLTILARHGVSYYLSRFEQEAWRFTVSAAARRRTLAAIKGASWTKRSRQQPAVEGLDSSSAPAPRVVAGDPADQRPVLPSSPGSVLLRGTGLTRVYGGVTAVKDLSFEVREGEILGLIGPNGAGQTTAFNLISGFVSLTSGALFWRDRPISRMTPQARARLGLVRTFQQPRTFPALTVRENLVIAAQSHRKRSGRSTVRPRQESTLESILDSFGFSRTADTPTEELSYGESKRLGVAMAVATNSELLMLDEPAAGLNAADVDQLRMDLLRLRAEGRTVWLVEHHMELVMEICDRVIVLDAGEVIAVGTPQEVVQDPRVVDAYLGGVPV